MENYLPIVQYQFPLCFGQFNLQNIYKQMKTVFLLITTFSIVSTERRPSIEESKNLTPNCLVMDPTHNENPMVAIMVGV